MTPAKRQKITHEVQNDNADCLTRLPNHVVSSILTILPTKDAFATRRLCGVWFNAWASDPILDFSGENDDVQRSRFDLQDDFVAFVDYTLSQLRHSKLIGKLKLRRRMFGRQALDRVESWLTLVSERNVRELDIDAVTTEIPYTLPQTVLRSASLTILKLANLQLKVLRNDNNNSLKSLKTLSLSQVKFDDESIRGLVSSCRSPERLEIWYCLGARKVRIRSPTLKLLDVRYYGALSSSPRIEVEEAKALEALAYIGKAWGDGYGKLESLKSLRLQVMWAGPPAAVALEGRIARLSSLEELRIGWWGGQGRRGRAVKICGPKLRHVEVDGNLANVHVVVDAPNLESLAYDRRFVSVEALNSPKLKRLE